MPKSLQLVKDRVLQEVRSGNGDTTGVIVRTADDGISSALRGSAPDDAFRAAGGRVFNDLPTNKGPRS